ncbi:MAG: tRNA dihydrouridine(20/20a) synthase DusA [Alphaproteobacteria bacterium]|nr:tRNA dihydrouridine(20/20a) synthase DusA [Alphaproteobacteria bacterium]
MTNFSPHRFTVAPMMGYSHRHFLAFMRIISKHCLLFTEMLPIAAVVANRHKLCDWRHDDAPLLVQLGGSDKDLLAQSCKIISDYGGATGINLNMGCPSSRVEKGAFGACLMLEPEKSASLVATMKQATDLPISVKLRIGVDKGGVDKGGVDKGGVDKGGNKTGAYTEEDAEKLYHLIELLVSAGATEIYLHARKAILKKLNPKQNRTIPPLRYDIASTCKQYFPDLPIIVNGGIDSMAQAQTLLQDYDGVMIGRGFINHPLKFRGIDKEIFGDEAIPSIDAIWQQYLEYIYQELARVTQGNHSKRYQQKSVYHFMLQPLLTFLYGMKGAKQWRVMINGLFQNPELLHDQNYMKNMQEFLRAYSVLA